MKPRHVFREGLARIEYISPGIFHAGESVEYRAVWEYAGRILSFRGKNLSEGTWSRHPEPKSTPFVGLLAGPGSPVEEGRGDRTEPSGRIGSGDGRRSSGIVRVRPG